MRSRAAIYFIEGRNQSKSKERFMIKPVIAATALIALAGSSFAYAQYGYGGERGSGGGPQVVQHHRLSAADVSAFADARIAALKAGLELTPDQTKNWPPFEQAVRDLVQLRIQRIQAMQNSADQNQPAPTPFDRLSRRADAMAKRSVALKKIADAGAPLYQSLNDEQKSRFVVLARMLRPHHHMQRFGQGYGRGGDGWRQHDGMQDNEGNDSKL
jgi:LTXXQ motif family protein